MANVANTVATGPASKGTVSGGTKFPLKDKDVSLGGNGFNLTNNPADAKSTIMSLRVRPSEFSSNVEGTLSRKPS